MNRSNLAGAAALVALAACAPIERDLDGTAARFPRSVTVNVVSGVITVPEGSVELYENNGAIRWNFGSNPASYVFPKGGIKFDRHPPVPPASLGCTSLPDPDTVFKNCKPRDHGESFQCVKTGQHVVGACFKYDIKVEPSGGGTAIALDPWAKLK